MVLHIIVHYSTLQYTEGTLRVHYSILRVYCSILQYTGQQQHRCKRHLLGTCDGLFLLVLYHLCSKVSVVSVNKQLQCGTQWRRSYWEKREGGREGGKGGGREGGREREGEVRREEGERRGGRKENISE